MKTSVIMISVLMVSFVSFSQKAKLQNVPQEIKKELLARFPNAKGIKWNKEGQNFEANFDINHTENSVLFNNQGQILETEVEINLSQLPKEALKYITNNFKSQKVKEAAKIVTQKGTIIFEAEIKGKDLLFDESGKLLSIKSVS